MKNFYISLYTYFSQTTDAVHNDFFNDVGGRMYQFEAPDDAEYPYCVYKHISDYQIDTFTSDIDNIIIQFSVYSEKSSKQEILNTMTHLKDLFTDCGLTVSNGYVIYFYWVNDSIIIEEVNTPSGIQEISHFTCDFNTVFERI